MRAAEFLAAASALPVVDLDGLVGAGGLVVVAPHPDDESLGCGGLIAEACARGRAVRLVVVSDGTGSHPNSPSHPPERLRALREREAVEAAGHLGLHPGHVRFLRLPDRFVPAAGPEAEAAAEAIADAAREAGASALFVTWDRDPHCDHAASAAIARHALARLPGARLLHYPVWGLALPNEAEVGGQPRGVRLDVARRRTAKAAAIAAHRSQTTALIDDDPSAFRLAPAMLARFAGHYETFLEPEEARP